MNIVAEIQFLVAWGIRHYEVLKPYLFFYLILSYVAYSLYHTVAVCSDGLEDCDARARRGECKSNPVMMFAQCKKACGICWGLPEEGGKKDSAQDNIRARYLPLAWSKLRLCSANHRAGYFSNLACDWLSITWAFSKQETENGPRIWKGFHSMCGWYQSYELSYLSVDMNCIWNGVFYFINSQETGKISHEFDEFIWNENELHTNLMWICTLYFIPSSGIHKKSIWTSHEFLMKFPAMKYKRTLYQVDAPDISFESYTNCI